MSESYDIVGIGNAIVDVIGQCQEQEITRLELRKGTMVLIDENDATRLYAEMGQTQECSGGSVANTLAGIAQLGGTVAFIGKVRDDQLGEIFRHDMRAAGVDFDTPSATDGPATARCLIFVTPDAQRTMCTYIGACAKVNEGDIDRARIEQGEMLYAEGYLWDQPEAKTAIRTAFEHAKKQGRKVAFTLSDVFCVERHRAEFQSLINDYSDILFANEDEILSLCETDDFEEALAKVENSCEIVAVTRGEKGCIILSDGQRETVPTQKLEKVIDTTGAGDLFAAGFLYGLSQGWNVKKSAQLGNRTAGVIIQQVGARSMTPLKPLVEQVTRAA